MDLDEYLQRNDRCATRAELVGLLGRHPFDNAVKSGALTAVFPRVYAWPWEVDDGRVRLFAAVKSVGGDVAASHLTALALRGLPVPDDVAIHATAYQPRHPRGVPHELIVHRTLLPLDAVEVDGLPVVRTEVALATSWPLLSGADQRAPIIEACRERFVSAARLARAAETMWWLKGVRGLRDLVGQVLAGCQSELELYGYLHVFAVPELVDAKRQKVLRIDGKEYRVDVAYEDEMLAVELDGRQFHASTARWERDIARDTALARIGWQTIRLSHSRLHGDVAGCRRDVSQVRSARRGLARFYRHGAA